MTTAYRSPDAPSSQASAPSPIANLATLFPRPHPSASTMRLLGALALVTGPLAGVPAILLGRVVEREVAASNNRLTGPVRRFVHLGWAGTYGGVFLVLYAIASSSSTFELILLLVGALAGSALAIGSLPRAPKALAAWKNLAQRAPVLVGVPIAGVLLAGAAGYLARERADEQRRVEAAERCDASLQAADEALAENRFDDGRSQISIAGDVCTGAALAAVSSRTAVLAEREAAYRKHREDEAAARRVRELATYASDASNYLQKAEALVAQRKWEAADQELRGAEVLLSGLRTRQAATEVVEPLAKRSAAVREQIAPGLEQARKTREAQEAAEEHRRAAREADVAAQEAAEERRRAAREAAASVQGSRGVLYCRDGSISGCSCTGPRRGCCSHHGGVAGCQ